MQKITRIEHEPQEDMTYGIFTKPIHVEKLVNWLNRNTDIDYIISTSKEEINAYSFDIGVSYCFPKIVNVETNDRITGKKRYWFNYHPAPLPAYPGLGNYAIPIADQVKYFGATLHSMTNDVDKGEIVKVNRFTLKTPPVNTNELGCITHYHLFQLFKETIEHLPFYINNMLKVKK